MGGSQGAVGLNQMVRPLLAKLTAAGVRVVHLTGSNDPEAGQPLPAGVVELPFSDEIPGLLQHAALAISRSGAGALSELAVCGTPAVLVPYPAAADHHQDVNAAAAAELGRPRSCGSTAPLSRPSSAAFGGCWARACGGSSCL